jgi:tRNA(Arg) A34 adenosine deaminase TadA
MNIHEKFMRAAITLSEASMDSGGGPFGAVIVKNGKIVGRGMNRVTIHNDPTAHAEIEAIRDACKKLSSFQLNGCIVYSSTEPCPMCFGAINWARPRAVYFANGKEDAAAIGFDDAFIYDEIGKERSKRKVKHRQIMPMRIHGLKAFKIWKGKIDRVEY